MVEEKECIGPELTLWWSIVTRSYTKNTDFQRRNTGNNLINGRRTGARDRKKSCLAKYAPDPHRPKFLWDMSRVRQCRDDARCALQFSVKRCAQCGRSIVSTAEQCEQNKVLK